MPYHLGQDGFLVKQSLLKERGEEGKKQRELRARYKSREIWIEDNKSLQECTKQERKECIKLVMTLCGKQKQNMSVLSKS